jgi:hypothetical protein
MRRRGQLNLFNHTITIGWGQVVVQMMLKSIGNGAISLMCMSNKQVKCVGDFVKDRIFVLEKDTFVLFMWHFSWCFLRNS